MITWGNLQLRTGIGRLLMTTCAAISATNLLTTTAATIAAIVLLALIPAAQGQAAQATNPTGPTTQAPIQRTAHAPRKPFRAARLTYLTGNVLVEQAKSRTQDVAVLNMPLVEGTELTTGEDGQAEIEFEDGSVLRITPNSGVSLVHLSVDGSDNYQTRVSVLGGLIYAELRAGTKYQYGIDAGGDVVTPIENSTLRMNLDEPPALIAVLQGSVHVTSVSGPATIDVEAGQTAQSNAEQQGTPFVVKAEIAEESWDQWNEDRDQAAAGEAGTRTAVRDQYAGDQGYGWSDLDANGSWYNVPGQGEVWQPDAAADDNAENSSAGADAGSDFGSDAGQVASQSPGPQFDPYGYGSWVYTPAGYSWASGYGWGWLPYRCGNWLYFNSFGWGWQPGITCGAFGFGGVGYGGYGFGVNVGRAPGFWKHPRRPIPGPGPVHPIIHGPVGTSFAVARTYGGGRLVRVKTVEGHTIEPLPPVASFSAPYGTLATGSALRRDYPVSTVTHEPSLGIAATHVSPAPALVGRPTWQSGSQTSLGSSPASGAERRPPLSGRSNMVPTWPSYGNQIPRPAQTPATVIRPQQAPAPRPYVPPAPRASAPAAAPARSATPAAPSSTPHK